LLKFLGMDEAVFLKVGDKDTSVLDLRKDAAGK